MDLTIKQSAEYMTLEQWNNNELTHAPNQTIEQGQVVEYLGHVLGGMVNVNYNGQSVIIHPQSTIELS